MGSASTAIFPRVLHTRSSYVIKWHNVDRWSWSWALPAIHCSTRSINVLPIPTQTGNHCFRYRVEAIKCTTGDPLSLSVNPAAAPRLSCALPLVGSSGQSDASPMTSVVGSSIAVRESSGRPSGRWLGRFPCLDDRGSRPSISDPICRLVGFWWILLAVSVFSLFCYSSDEICVVFEIDFGAPSRNLRRSTVHFGHRTEAENSRASLVRFSFVIYPWI